jgi:hypothetical protein
LSDSVSTGFAIFVWIIALALWVLFGLWGGRLAVKYGLEYWIGFLIGFFGGLIGILVLWLIGRSHAEELRRRAQYGQPPYPPAQYPGYGPPGPDARGNPLKVCERCGKLVQADVRFCQYCGGAFTSSVG